MFKRLLNPIISDSFFLFGARGTGKTTFLTHFFKDLEVIWINLLDPAEEDLFLRKPEEFAARLQHTKPGTWVIVDEIQKAPKLLNLVHHLIETKKIKFALTGSSARRLRQRGVNLLAGRAFTNYFFPVVAIDIIHFCQKKLVDDFGSLKIERCSLIPLG